MTPQHEEEESSLSSLDTEDMYSSSSQNSEDYDTDNTVDDEHVHAYDSQDEDDDDNKELHESFINDIKANARAPLNAEEMRLRTTKELEMIATLVPARLLFAHMNGERRIPRGAMREEFDGAVLFADISGFTKLAESLLAKNINASNAAENLVKYVGWNLNEMVEVICNAGGDCMKFAGDAILAVFAANEFDGSLERAAYSCAQAALALQGLQLNAARGARLSIHSGMGVGRVATYEVGGVLDRWEIFVAGSPVEQIGRCEPLAKAGQLVVSYEARVCIERISKIEGEMVEGGDFRLDRLVDLLPARTATATPAQRIERLASEHPERASDLKRILMKYVSRPVIFTIESHAQSLWGAELRDCSTLFCKFKGLNFSENNEDDLAVVQYVVKNVVQKVMQSLEGTVCRFMVDDKGASMLLAFGLVPYAHVNDCVRAVKAALLIRDGVAALSLLSKDSPPAGKPAAASPRKMPRRRSSAGGNNTVVTSFQGLDEVPQIKSPISCQIGITHGRVCVGMVGGTTRCEYTLHGVLVNRAARLMGLATDGVILCDKDAYDLAKAEVEFDSHYTVHRLKGERKDVQVYKALKKASGQSVANTRPNLFVDSCDSGLVARSTEKIALDAFLTQLNGELPHSGVVGVKGEPGIGKSLVLQYVAKRAQTKFRTTVLSGFALDTETSTPFFAWKNLVIQLISGGAAPPPSSSQQQQQLHTVGSKEAVLTSHGSFMGAAPARPAFADMTNEERKQCLIEALPLEKREYYPLLAQFVDEVIPSSLLEDNEISMNIVRAQRSTVAMETVVSMLTNFANTLQKRGERLVLVLDDIHWMDELSLELLHLVAKTLPRVGVFVAFVGVEGKPPPLPCTGGVWALPRLQRSELAECMEQWLDVTKVQDSCVSFLYEKTNGNPLFSEELCHLMLEKKFFDLDDTGACVFRTVPDPESLKLTSSIQSIMNVTLDRLSASQQIVVRVVAMMGMQCTLQDLGGVFREINERSTNRLLGLNEGVDSDDEDYDDASEEAGYFSLADMLKHGFDEPKLVSKQQQGEFQESRQRLAALFTSINVEEIITSLVDKGVIEAKRYGNRTVYVFRHMLMKITCLDGLRAKVKQMLHATIALYYENRPMHDTLAWSTILADHFFKAKKMRMKAFKYLQMAGNLASEQHANQQVFSIYTRLIELYRVCGDEIAVSDLSVAQWHRKMAASLYHLNETYHAERLKSVERNLKKSLLHLGLDVTSVQGMSGIEAGFLLPQDAAAAAQGSPFPTRTSSFRVFRKDSPLNSCLHAPPMTGSTLGAAASPQTVSSVAEDVVMEIPGRKPPPTRLTSLFRSFSFTERQAEGFDCSADCAEDVEPFIDEQDYRVVMVEDAPSLVLSTPRMSTPASSGSVSGRRRSLLLNVDPNHATGLRPRLVLSLSAFRRFKREAATQEGEIRNNAVECLLEAAAAYDLLSTMRRDRNDIVALECRLNAILLAEAAAAAFAGEAPPPPLLVKSPAAPQLMFGMRFPHQQQRSVNANSALQQRCQDQLSRAYSRAATFFAGMQISTRWRSLGRMYAQKANQFLKLDQQQQDIAMGGGGGGGRMAAPRLHHLHHASDFDQLGSSSAEYSENIINLRRNCGKWDVIQGNFCEAKEKLRYAVWGAKFMHLESMFDAKALELAVFFFNGDLDSCNRNASEFFEKNTPPRFVAMGARFMALCGAYDVAMHKLTAIAGAGGAALERGLREFNDPNAWLALSLVAWRVDRNHALALRAVIAASECVLAKELGQLSITVFHELALCFTAFWDPIRECPYSVDGMQQEIQVLLMRLTNAVRSFALVYRVCRPHAKYCFALRNKMFAALLSIGPPAVQPQCPSPPPPQTVVAPTRTSSQFSLFSLCASSSSPKQDSSSQANEEENGPFHECARFAQEHECFWVQGLALLEIDSVKDWLDARDVFVAYEHASYELARCDRRLREAQNQHSPRSAAVGTATAVSACTAVESVTTAAANSNTQTTVIPASSARASPALSSSNHGVINAVRGFSEDDDDDDDDYGEVMYLKDEEIV